MANRVRRYARGLSGVLGIVVLLLANAGRTSSQEPSPGQPTSAPEAGPASAPSTDESANKEAARPGDPRRQRSGRAKPDEADQALEEAGRARWSKATPTPPDVTSGTSFLLFSKLPETQARNLVKTLDAEIDLLRDAIGADLSKILESPEKISIYVLPDPNAYIAFARGVENRKVDAKVAKEGEANANFKADQPYLVALAPEAGSADAAPPAQAAPARKATRGARRARTDATQPTGPERSLVGLLSEQFVTAVCDQAGKTPPWLRLGLAAHMAEQAEPRSPYYQRLRDDLANLASREWNAERARNLLNNGSDPQRRAAGLGFLDFLGESNPDLVAPLARQLILDGPGQLDNLLKQGLEIESADQFYEAWGEWIQETYSQR